MTAYLVSIIRILDREKFAEFRASSPRAAAQFGGEEVLRGKVLALLEGTGECQDEMVAVVRFPNAEAARALTQSRQFQEAQQRRRGIVEVNLRLVDDNSISA